MSGRATITDGGDIRRSLRTSGGKGGRYSPFDVGLSLRQSLYMAGTVGELVGLGVTTTGNPVGGGHRRTRVKMTNCRRVWRRGFKEIMRDTGGDGERNSYLLFPLFDLPQRVEVIGENGRDTYNARGIRFCESSGVNRGICDSKGLEYTQDLGHGQLAERLEQVCLRVSIPKRQVVAKLSPCSGSVKEKHSEGRGIFTSVRASPHSVNHFKRRSHHRNDQVRIRSYITRAVAMQPGTPMEAFANQGLR